MCVSLRLTEADLLDDLLYGIAIMGLPAGLDFVGGAVPFPPVVFSVPVRSLLCLVTCGNVKSAS
jgi:hypothetical protein